MHHRKLISCQADIDTHVDRYCF